MTMTELLLANTDMINRAIKVLWSQSSSESFNIADLRSDTDIYLNVD